MNYKTKTLDNGTRVVAAETKEFKAIYAHMTVLGGSAFETTSNNGISHLVEHVMLQGNAKFEDDSKFDDVLERLGGSSNGSTSEFNVVTYVKVPNSELDFAIEHLYHTASTATFTENHIAHEKKVVSDEIHSFETDPYYEWYEFWNDSRYTKETVPLFIIGKKDKVNSFTREQLIDWYHTIFNPQNIVITLVGDIDPKVAINKVEKLFGGLTAKSGLLELDKLSPRNLDSNVISTLVDTNRDEAFGNVSFPFQPLLETDLKDRKINMLLSLITVNLRNSILYKKLRKDLGWLYHIGGTMHQYPTYDGISEISFATSSDKVGKVYKVIFNELNDLVSKGVTPEMFDYAMESSINTLKMSTLSLSKVFKNIHGYYYWFNEVMTIDESIKAQKEITLDMVNDRLKAYIDPKQMAIISRVQSEEHKEKLQKTIKNLTKDIDFK